MPPIAKDRIERAARMYASNHDAGSALGIAPGSFSRLCRRYGIETPQARKRRRRSEWRQDYLSLHKPIHHAQRARQGAVICRVSTKSYSSAT